MIIAKPKLGTLFSLGIFVVISLGVAIYTASLMWGSLNIPWYQYLIVIILFPLSLGLTARIILGYRIIEIGKERFDIYFPTRFSRKSYRLKEIEYWKETKVKTATGLYREVEIRFEDNKQVTLSYQEHSDYDKVIKYLKKKCAKKDKS